MGQWDVYEWLKYQYEMGKRCWFTPKEIEKGLKDKGFTQGYLVMIRTDLIKLATANCIDYKDLDKTGLSNYNKVFRFKEVKNGNKKLCGQRKHKC